MKIVIFFLMDGKVFFDLVNIVMGRILMIMKDNYFFSVVCDVLLILFVYLFVVKDVVVCLIIFCFCNILKNFFLFWMLGGVDLVIWNFL